MIASRFLSREEWEKKLRSWGCTPLQGKTSLNTAEWWKGPKGYPFTVPVEGDDDACEFWALQKICIAHGRSPFEIDNTPHNGH